MILQFCVLYWSLILGSPQTCADPEGGPGSLLLCSLHSVTNGGKTTLTNSLLKALPNCCAIHQDDFFKVAPLSGVEGGGPPRRGPPLPTAHVAWANTGQESERQVFSPGHPLPTGQMGKLWFPEGLCHPGCCGLLGNTSTFPSAKWALSPPLMFLRRVRDNEMMDAKSPPLWVPRVRVQGVGVGV